MSGGRGEPDAAAIAGAIEACAGAKCEMNVGKPDPPMLETIVGRIGLDAADCVMTGDRLYTEIRMALDADMVSALVLTGKTTAEMLAVGPEGDKLDCILATIDCLIPGRLWEQVDWSEDEA